MISVRNQWLIDRTLHHDEERGSLSLHTIVAYIHTWLCQGKSADKDSTQENHYKLVFNNTAVRTKDMLRFTDSRGVLYVVCTATQKPFFMLSHHFIMEWAMSCELPLLVPFIGIVLSPGCAIKWWAYEKKKKEETVQAAPAEIFSEATLFT